jgi:precorrin-2/cobalt-factor-2 C20-methyltransferase
MTGTLYVVGVGPGDPELMTLKSVRVITSSAVVASFCKRGRPGHARSISAAHVSPANREIRFEYPFTVEVDVANPRYLSEMGEFYEACAVQLGEFLASGEDVALLCEGDPFFYGSAMYLYDRLRTRFATEIVPGITGMSGAWSRAGCPMVHGDDVLSVLPGTLAEDELVARLSASEASVIMKIGRNMPKICNALARAGLLERAIYVERGTMAEEIILPLAQLDRKPAPYFALVLVPGRQGAR